MKCRAPFALVVAAAGSIALGACRTDPAAARKAYFDAGNSYFAQQKYADAIIEYRNAIKRDPRFGEARYRLGEALMRTGDVQGASREYIRAADLMPDNPEAQLLAGRVLLITRQFEDARSRAQRVLAKDSKNVDAQILLGNALAGMRDLDGAIAQIQTAVDADPDRAGTYMTLGQMQRARGDLKAAQAAFEAAVADNPKSLKPQLAIGNFYWSIGRLADAEAAFKKAVAAAPADPLANRALAALYLTTERPAQAAAYVEAMAANPEDGDARLGLADYYSIMGRYDEAIKVLEPLAAHKAFRTAATERLATVEYAAGRRGDARRRVEALLAADPHDARALLLSGRLDLVDGRLEPALTSVQASIAADPNLPGAYYTLGLIQLRRLDLQAATESFNSVLRLSPNDVATRVQLSRLALAAGTSDRSVQFASEAAAADPRNGGVRIALARALLAKRDFDNAGQQVRLLVASFPDQAVPHVLDGELQTLTGKLAAARAAFGRALQLDPRNVEACGGLVALDLQAGKYDAARARIDARLAQAPRDTAVLLLAAQTYAAGRDVAKAEQLLKTIIQIEPAHLTAYSVLARLYLAQKRLPEALAEFDAFSRTHQDAVGAETMSAMILETLGRTDEARRRYEAILADAPRSAVAANNLAWQYAEAGQNLDAAVQLAQTAKQLLPDRPEVDDTLGWVYYRKGLPALAIPPLEHSVGAAPRNPLFRYHLGLSYARAGEEDKARAMLNQALELKLAPADAGKAMKTLATLGG